MSKSRRTVPDRAEAKSERFRHKIVQRLSSDQRRAKNHGLARNGRVAETLCFMALIRDPTRRKRPILPIPNVSCTAAVRQFFRADDGEQAAHLLPGQISIDGAFPWLFLAGAAARQLENLFAYVEPLRADYNKADSAALTVTKAKNSSPPTRPKPALRGRKFLAVRTNSQSTRSPA